MATISIQRDPSNITNVERNHVDGQINLLQWLCENEPVNFDGLHATVVLNNRVILNTWESSLDECNERLDIELGVFDNVSIILRPQAVDPVTIAIIAVATIVSAAIAIALAPKPTLPQSIDEAGERQSNNQLNAAKNSYRPRQAIADIGGEVISYPNFVQPSYYQYKNNRREYREILVIGVGQYDVSDVKIGDDLINDINGSDYTEYYDSTPPNLINVRSNYNSQEVDIPAPDSNESTVTLADEGSINASSSEIVLGESLMNELGLQNGDTVELEFTYTPDAPGQPDINISRTDTVVSFDANSFVVSGGFGFDGSDLNGYIRKTTGTIPEVWYVLEGDAIEEVWLDLKMPQGIRADGGGFTEITCTLTIEELNSSGTPTGTTYSRGCVFAGNTRSSLFQTFKLTQSDGIGVGRFRAKIERTTNTLGGTAIELVTMESVKSVTPYTADFGQVTTLDVIRSSNARVARGQSEKINALVTRKLRVYNPDTEVYSSSYTTTRRFCDYVFYMLHELAGVAIEDIDRSIFDIHDNLSDSQLGQFDGTFDDKNQSLRDRVELVCNVARVKYWNVGLKWFFVREESKPVSTMMFNRRNLKRDQVFVQKFKRPSDFDGVTVIYVDPVTNSESRIYRSITSGGSISTSEGNNSIEFNMVMGCRNQAQAENRAELEVRRLLYQNIKVTDTALSESLEMQIGERVDYVDIYDGDTFDGEIVGVSGNVYTTTERFEPESGQTYYVYITDDNGNISNSVVATPRSDGNIYGFEATGLSGAYLASGTIQSGSRYVIATTDDLEASSYIAISRGRPNQQGECKIELAEYNELMFEAD